jgi:hypothetical protein
MYFVHFILSSRRVSPSCYAFMQDADANVYRNVRQQGSMQTARTQQKGKKRYDTQILLMPVTPGPEIVRSSSHIDGFVLQSSWKELLRLR